MSSFAIPHEDEIDPAVAREQSIAETLAALHEHEIEERAKRQSRGEDMTLADEIGELMRKRTRKNLEASRKPLPHLFRLGESASFPRGEGGVLGGPGREGKTAAIIAVAVAGALGRDMGNQPCEDGPFSTVIFSAEDSVEQYDRKLDAQLSKLSDADQDTVLDRVRIVDLDQIKERVGAMVLTIMGQPQKNVQLIEAMITACQRPVDGNPIDEEWDAPLGLVVGETLSTLSDAAEDNPGVRMMAEAGKRIARELGVHWLTCHHTSQIAAANLPALSISSNDIRGGRSLIDNTRQTWFLVNLGNEDDPFPDKDARTMLRKMVAPGRNERVSALICLDSSKAIDPPPLFFAWDGVRQVVIDLPAAYHGMRWKRLHREIGKAKTELAEDERESKRKDEVSRCVAFVYRLHEEGKPPTVRAVSQAAGRSDHWAGPYLVRAVQLGLVCASDEIVPRVKGLTRVYRPIKDEP